MEFLALTDVDLGVINGGNLILFVDDGTSMELHFTHDDVFEIDDGPTMAYVRAYAQAKQFFVLGNTHYNPVQVHHVEVDTDAGVAYITDANGEPRTITEAAEIATLQQAAGTFVWLPPTEP